MYIKIPIFYSFLYIILICILYLLICLLLAYHRLQTKSWFLQSSLNPLDFHAKAELTIQPIPITYYKTGQLNQTLKKFHSNSFGKGFIHLYRINKSDGNERYHLEKNILDFKIDVIHEYPYCEEQNLSSISILCGYVCIDSNQQVQVDVHDILDREHSPYIATFSEIKNYTIIEKVLESLGASDIGKTLLLEQVFITNLKESRVTAPIHAAQLVSSMAVQFIGRKTWLFFDANTYLNDMNPIPSWGSSYPTKSPDKPYKVYIYHSEPGDVLFFSDNYAHIVYTWKGPNVMINMRQMSFDNFWRQPINWLHGVMIYFNTRNDLFYKREHFPNDQVNQKASDLSNELCDNYSPEFLANPKLTDWDSKIRSILMSEVQKIKESESY